MPDSFTPLLSYAIIEYYAITPLMLPPKPADGCPAITPRYATFSSPRRHRNISAREEILHYADGQAIDIWPLRIFIG
jgi:hypothetical protein